MRIRLLGPLQVLSPGHGPLVIGTPKQRQVLAMLAVEAGRTVTIDQLVNELWPTDPPRSAVANARTYAANLRRMFEAHRSGRNLLVRDGGGYRLGLGPAGTDLHLFEAECADARHSIAQNAHQQADRLLKRALGRWNGPMLAGVPLGPLLATRVAASEEERILATECLAEVCIQRGHPGAAVPLLRDLVGSYPLRETAYVLLVKALHRLGDHPGALSAYQSAREILSAELGIEPGRDLQDLYRDIRRTTSGSLEGVPPGQLPGDLRGRADSGLSRAFEADGTARAVDWLPRSVPTFIGREDLVARLLDRTRRTDGLAPTVHLIDGMAGSGKTTLAVHVARRLSSSFRDAQLFIDLRGHGAAVAVEPAAALIVLLRQLGVPAGRIPVHVGERTELWRHELASRRVVVVLDNAADDEQVAPLLPTAPGSVVLITSRRRLVDLDSGPPESLPPMSEQEAVALLAASVGRQRVEQEREAAAELVRHCGCLPLAVRLAGARLAHRRNRRIAELASQLGPGAPVLQELRAGNKTVMGAFAASYEPLEPGSQRTFRLLGTHAGHYNVPMVAAMTGLSHAAAADILDELVDCNLVEETEDARYRLHDLVRHFAIEQSRASDPVEVRSTAARQLLDHALHSSLRAGEALHEAVAARSEVPTKEPLRPDLLRLVGDQGPEWLERERAELVMLVRLAVDLELDTYAWQLARALWRFFYVRGYFDDIIVTQQLGLTAARRLNDKRAVALMCNYLASGLVKTGKYPEARRCLETATEISREIRDVEQIRKLRANQAVVHWLSGELVAAVSLGTEILRDGEADTATRMAYVLPNLGLALTTLGRYDDALRIHRIDLFRARSVNDEFFLANALSHLAAVRVRTGQVTPAIRLLTSSLRLYDRSGHRYGEADARNLLGVAYRMIGRFEEASQQHRLALDLAEDSGERPAQCAALNDLGITLAVTGASDTARVTHERALSLATRIAHPYEQGRALAGLAEHALAKDVAEARRYWERALAIFRRMGVPERFEVERRLAELRDHGR